ncbi:MAG: sodium:proton antiporter NhaD [Thermodesulfobacteriota bacterium]
MEHLHDMTTAWVGFVGLIIFVSAYILVILEDKIHLRKSKPVLLFGCLMWMFIGIYELTTGGSGAEHHVKELAEEIAELFFFVFVAMTFINSLEERLVFEALRAWLLRKGFTYGKLFWITGLLTFFLSPVADNLTSALVMSTVVSTVGGKNRRFIVAGFINVVVAANAGGAWSPFGDITTLMVWTSGKIETLQFMTLFIPSVINWAVPAAILYMFVPKGTPTGSDEQVKMKPAARLMIFLGFFTIATAVTFHQALELPPFLGMMTGLGLLMFTGYFVKKKAKRNNKTTEDQFDIFRKIESVEFDTLLFFFGIITAVGALQYMGYLVLLNHHLYGGFGPTIANIAIGVFSSIVDNIPLTYAVIQMDPSMGLDQWLLITLTAGTGGSLLSIGSAAGVGCMGVRRDIYTFVAHMKYAPIVAVGYAASIAAWYAVTHLLN